MAFLWNSVLKIKSQTSAFLSYLKNPRKRLHAGLVVLKFPIRPTSQGCNISDSKPNASNSEADKVQCIAQFKKVHCSKVIPFPQ